MVFGEKLRNLREKRGLTRETLCDDESQLSVRQLARFEAGKSIPTLPKLLFLAQKLSVTLNELTDEFDYRLPERYTELKFLIIRTATYGDPDRVRKGDEYFDEIYSNYYDKLPEEEQIAIDCLQSRWDVHFSGDINFGMGILTDYFSQVQSKKEYTVNDLLIIDLYMLCTVISVHGSKDYDEKIYDNLMEKLLKQGSTLPKDCLHVLNNVLLNSFHLALMLGKENYVNGIISKSQELMVQIQDFQKKPVLNLFKWKLALKDNDLARAEEYKAEAMLFAQLIGDDYLAYKLNEEWDKDIKKTRGIYNKDK